MITENKQCTIDESTLDHILILQKDSIRSKIQAGKYKEARICLSLVRSLWLECNYEYKYKELSTLINERVNNGRT